MCAAKKQDFVEATQTIALIVPPTAHRLVLSKFHLSPVILAILVELFVIGLFSAAISTSAVVGCRARQRTLRNRTLGTMVVCNALGASLTPLLGSPPGWY